MMNSAGFCVARPMAPYTRLANTAAGVLSALPKSMVYASSFFRERNAPTFICVSRNRLMVFDRSSRSFSSLFL